MKHILKYISFSLVLALSFTSCDTDEFDEIDDVRDIGGYAHLNTRRISQFDTNSNMTVTLFTASGVSVESVEIVRDGSVIGTATVSGETATFSSSILGNIAAGTYPVRVRATLSNGNVAEQPASITVVNSLTLDGDNPTDAALSELPALELAYDTYTFSATIDNVDLHLKNGAEGTYMDSGVDNIDGSVVLGDTNYQDLNLAVNDTLYYRFTATSGSLTQSAESYIVIIDEPEVEEPEAEEPEGDESDEDDESDEG